jgi:hypothetical protein
MSSKSRFRGNVNLSSRWRTCMGLVGSKCWRFEHSSPSVLCFSYDDIATNNDKATCLVWSQSFVNVFRLFPSYWYNSNSACPFTFWGSLFWFPIHTVRLRAALNGLHTSARAWNVHWITPRIFHFSKSTPAHFRPFLSLRSNVFLANIIMLNLCQHWN